MTSPSNQVREYLLLASKLGARLFRRNVGFGWIASPAMTIKATSQTYVTMYSGDVLLRQPRPFNNGIPGMPDTDGWLSVTITADMVGQKIAQYVAIEVKQGTGRLSKDQKAWIEAVKLAGGRAGVARSPEDVRGLLG